MTTSDYLKIQADLLIAIQQLRKLPLAEFADVIARVMDCGGELHDATGCKVQSDLAYMLHVTQAAEQFRQSVASYQPTVRKAMQVSNELQGTRPLVKAQVA